MNVPDLIKMCQAMWAIDREPLPLIVTIHQHRLYNGKIHIDKYMMYVEDLMKIANHQYEHVVDDDIIRSDFEFDSFVRGSHWDLYP